MSPTLAASSRTTSRTFWVNGLVPTARFSDFWNFAVAIICIVLVILRMFRTALRRFTIARALAIAREFRGRRGCLQRDSNGGWAGHVRLFRQHSPPERLISVEPRAPTRL